VSDTHEDKRGVQKENIMKMICTALLIPVAGLLLLANSVAAVADDEAELLAIISAIEAGWENGDGTPFREHFLDFSGARYVESGGQNEGLDDLIDHHVVPEGDFLEQLTLSFTNMETHFEGDFAWAIVNTEIEATVKSDGREIHNRGYETFLFRNIDGQWKVVHTHSSSRPVTQD
jgi:hypothetical protein